MTYNPKNFPETGHKGLNAQQSARSGTRSPALVHPSPLKVQACLDHHHAQIKLHASVTDTVKVNGLSPALANAHLTAPQLSTTDFPHWGYLEYLALIDDDIQWTPLTQLKANQWLLKDLAYLLSLSHEQVRNYANWWKPGVDGVSYGRLKARPLYHLCQCLGVPLGGLLWDARRRNDKTIRNVGLPLALSMIEMVRPHLVAFDKWVFENLTSQYFSVIPVDRMIATVYRHRYDAGGEYLESSLHQNLVEEHMMVLPSELRIIVRNLRQLLRDSPMDHRKKAAFQQIEPLEMHWQYWVLARARFSRLKSRRVDLEPKLKRYLSFSIDATEVNQFDEVLEKFPNFRQSVLRAKEWPGIPKVRTVSPTTLHPYPHPAQQAWLDQVSARLDRIPWTRIDRWLPIHQVIIRAMVEVVKEAIVSIEPGQYHGGWRWLGQLRPYIDTIVKGVSNSDANIHLELSAFFSLLGLVGTQSQVDIDAYSRAWRGVHHKPQVLETLQNPHQYLIPISINQNSNRMKPILHPVTLDALRAYSFTFLHADLDTVDRSVHIMLRGFMLRFQGTWRGAYNFASRAMEPADPAWVDVLHQLSLGNDLRPPGAGLVETFEVLPAVADVLRDVLAQSNFESNSSAITEGEVGRSELEMAGPRYMGQLWLMSPGTTPGGSVLPGGARCGVMEHRDQVMHLLYDSMPVWAGFMKKRWKHFNAWFCTTRSLGKFFTEWMRSRDRAAVESQLCDTPANIEYRLIPLLRIAHVPLPTFIKWMMALRWKGREISGCHYYIKSERVDNGRKVAHPMKTWEPPSLPGCDRRHDQLYLLWNHYLQLCKDESVEVPKELQPEAFNAWYELVEAKFGEATRLLNEVEREAKKEKFIAEEIQASADIETREATRKANLRELEG